MLDDCGSHALPLLELYIHEGNEKYFPVIQAGIEMGLLMNRLFITKHL
jgi:hypothetical protein